jgi:sec-independent protein translocase protein TatC
MLEDLHPHLEDLRKRLIISVATLFISFIVMFYFHEALLDWIVAPLNHALHQVGKESVLAAHGMVTTNQVGGTFFVAMKVAFFAAILVSVPVILWQIWLFIAPGLYANEKKVILPFIFGGTVMFVVGVAFAYYVVTPFGFKFLITFATFKFTPLINIEDYIGFFTKIMIGFGIAFELPVFAYFLALIGLITDKTLIEFFRYAIVIIFILAALLTPPDVMTQMLMAGPLIALYGLSILIVKIVNPAEKEDDDEEEKETDTAEKAQTAAAKEKKEQEDLDAQFEKLAKETFGDEGADKKE